MITISRAALIYGTSEQTIKSWIKKYKITYSKIGKECLIDEESLGNLIKLNIRISNYCEEREQEIQIREEILSDAILKLDNLIFLFKKYGKISSLLRIIINEMATQISSEQRRFIFIKIASGIDASQVAKTNGITLDNAYRLFNESIRELEHKLGFLNNYQKTLEEKNNEINTLRMTNRNQVEYIRTLTNIIDQNGYLDENQLAISPQVSGQIPWHYFKILSLNIADNFVLDTRIKNCFVGLRIETVEDLIRYIKKYGNEHLLDCQNFGRKSLEILKTELLSYGIIDDHWNSKLFDYIEVEH